MCVCVCVPRVNIFKSLNLERISSKQWTAISVHCFEWRPNYL